MVRSQKVPGRAEPPAQPTTCWHLLATHFLSGQEGKRDDRGKPLPLSPTACVPRCRGRQDSAGLQVFRLVSLEYKLDCLYHRDPMRRSPTTSFVLVGDMIHSRAIRKRRET